ncbi:unnamed protein product, partial [Didymodactylos carnosus]
MHVETLHTQLETITKEAQKRTLDIQQYVKDHATDADTAQLNKCSALKEYAHSTHTFISDILLAKMAENNEMQRASSADLHLTIAKEKKKQQSDQTLIRGLRELKKKLPTLILQLTDRAHSAIVRQK